MRTRRAAGWVLIGILSLVALAGIALWAGLSSDRVARRLIAKGLERAGDMVQIGRVRGTLGGPLILTDVRIRTETFVATVDSMLLDWTPIGLVRREVRIDRLHVTGLHVELPDSVPADTAAPQRPELPVDVLLGDVVIRDITVDAPGDVGLSDGWARLDGRADGYRLVARGRAFTPQLDSVPFALDARGTLERMAIDRADVDLLDGRIVARGRLAWWPRVSWNLGIGARDVRPALLMENGEAWDGRLSALARTAGHLDSTGPHARLIVDSLGGELRGEPVAGTADLRIDSTAIAVDALAARWGSATLEASGTIEEMLDLRFDADIGNLGLAVPDAAGSLRAAGTVEGPREAAIVRTDLAGRNLRFGTNRLDELDGSAVVGLAPDGPANVTLRGRDASVGATAIRELALRVRGLRSAHTISAEAAGDDGELSLAARGGLRESTWSGTIRDLRVAPDALGVWQLERPAALTAGAELVRLEQLCLASDASRICAGGRWRDNGNWTLDAAAEELPLALLDSLVPDTARAGARALEGTVTARADLAAAGGRIRGVATLSAADAAILFPVPGDTAPERLVFDTAGAELRFGAAGADGSAVARFVGADGAPVGSATVAVTLPGFTRIDQPVGRQRLDASLEAVVEDLSLAGRFDDRIDSLTGRMTLSGTAGGTVGAPEVSAAVNLENLVAWLAGSRVARGAVEASLDADVGPDRALAGRLEIVPRGVIYEYPLADVRRTIALDSGRVEVQAGSDGIEAVLALGMSDSAGGRLATFGADLALPEYERLGEPLPPQPVRLRFTADVADLAIAQTVMEQFDTLTGRLTADLTVDGTIGAPSIEGTVELRELVALFPQGGAIVGGLDAALDATVARDSTVTGSLSVTPAGLALRVEEGGRIRLIPIDSTGLAATVGAGGTEAEIALRLADSTETLGLISGELRLPSYRRLGAALEGQPLAGSIRARFDDLAFLEGLTSQVDSAAGRLEADASLGGTVGEPRATGTLALTDGVLRLPLLGVVYEDIQLTASADNSDAFTVDGSLRSGGGTLAVDGTYPLVATDERPATLEVEGTDFEAVRTEDVYAVVSPDLTVRLTGQLTEVEGEVTIPRARVELSEIPEVAVAPSDDVVFVQDTATALTGPRAFAARVRVILGDSVTFRGFNFNAEFGGRLTYVQEPEEIATASGEVVIEQGRYRAYGQDLTITDGTLRFAGGPVDDPGLAIRAVRTAEDGVVAGLQIGGTLQDPIVTIFSEPAMSQSRALSYIILGRPPGEGTGGGGTLLSKAATSLGLRGGNALAGSLGRGLGLSQAGIESEGGTTSFVAGAYLAPNVYVSYGIGLFDPLTRIRLRYDLSRRWAIQAERGSATGADVLFTTERGD